MRKIFSLIVIVISLQGCAILNGGAYNSRNLLDLVGEDMTFTQGLIAVRNVDRVVILRETNAGNSTAPNPLPAFNMDYCPADNSDLQTKAPESSIAENFGLRNFTNE